MCFLCSQGDRGEMGLPGPPGEKGAMVRSKSGSRLCSQGKSNTHLTLDSHYNSHSSQLQWLESSSMWENASSAIFHS